MTIIKDARAVDDPANFQTYDGRGSRWYIDPLPGDHPWGATETKYPAVSTIKKAWPKEFSKKLPDGTLVDLDGHRAGVYVVENLVALGGMNRDAAIRAVALAPKVALNQAGDRGSDVHLIVQALAIGGEIPLAELENPDESLQYVDVCRRFIAEQRPEILYTEVAGINRTLHGAGYGGTVDNYASLKGGALAIVDYKSRGVDSAHKCYEEEAGQLGAYWGLDYLFREGPTGAAMRLPKPFTEWGYIVSLRPDSYEVYPVDLKLAFESFALMHQCWIDKSEGQKIARKARQKGIIGAPVKVERLDLGLIPMRLEALRQFPDAAKYVREWWPAGCPRMVDGGPTTQLQVDALLVVLDTADATFGVPWADVAPVPEQPEQEPAAEPVPQFPKPDGEGPADPASVRDLRAIVGIGTPEGRLIARWNRDATAAGHSFHLTGDPVVRQYQCAKVAYACARLIVGDPNPEHNYSEDDLRGVIAGTIRNDDVLQMGVPFGVVIGALTVSQALAVHDLAVGLADGREPVYVDASRVLRAV